MLNIIEINNFNAPELDVYARYTEAQLLNKDRPEDGLFIAESPKVIGRALDAGYIPISVLVEKKQKQLMIAVLKHWRRITVSFNMCFNLYSPLCV